MKSDVLEDIYLDIMMETLESIFDRGIRDKGKTKVINHSKIITKNEIQSILNLLHSDYDNLGAEITIYKNKYQPLLRVLNPCKSGLHYETFKMVFKRIIGGNHFRGIISLFPFNHYFKSDEEYKLFLTYDILHEIRHAYQRIHKEKKYHVHNQNYIDATKSGYANQWLERDANQFATRMMNKYKNKINEILNVKLEWNCIWGRFIFKR
ncbi:DUF3920 family protein [Metabacillus fastidiosus]|uniref:DUF3920 family protein n=1 Tax=Metabacillus fastidiosus TaxID=1458 RepID=UPI003D2B3A5B